MSERRLLVMGFGSPLRGDDAAGIVALRRLRSVPLPAGVDLIEGGVRGIDLLARVQDYPRAVILDAFVSANSELAVGTVVHQQLESVQLGNGIRLSLHELDLGATLRLAQAMEMKLPPIELILVRVSHVENQQGLSPRVAAAIPEMVRTARERIETLVSGGFSDVEDQGLQLVRPAGRGDASRAGGFRRPL